MEKCVRCNKETRPTSSTAISPKGKFIGVICCECRDEILEDYIVENKIEYEVPTLEERVRIIMCEVPKWGLLDRAEKVIAMVREHDAKDFAAVYSMKDMAIKQAEEWMGRAKKAEATLAEIAMTAQAASKREG